MNEDRLKKLEADLWGAVDKLRANSDLKSGEYTTPVLRPCSGEARWLSPAGGSLETQFLPRPVKSRRWQYGV